MFHISLGKLFQADSLKVLLPQILSHSEFLNSNSNTESGVLAFYSNSKTGRPKREESQVLQERLKEVKKNKAS